MGILKTREIKEMSLEELAVKRRALSEELAKERGHIASGTRPDNPGRIRAVRKTIARIKTIERLRELQTKEQENKKKSEVQEKK